MAYIIVLIIGILIGSTCALFIIALVTASGDDRDYGNCLPRSSDKDIK